MTALQRIALATTLALLAGCGHEPPAAAPPAAPRAASHKAAPAAAPAPAVALHQRTSYDNIDSYKVELAEHIVSRNAEHTFSGQLPPMLPAIVVLRISVNGEGRMTEVAVQRSRDSQASAVALAAMRRGGQLPRPQNLVASAGRSVSFSETFLFNRDYKFQLRSLAGPQ